MSSIYVVISGSKRFPLFPVSLHLHMNSSTSTCHFSDWSTCLYAVECAFYTSLFIKIKTKLKLKPKSFFQKFLIQTQQNQTNSWSNWVLNATNNSNIKQIIVGTQNPLSKSVISSLYIPSVSSQIRDFHSWSFQSAFNSLLDNQSDFCGLVSLIKLINFLILFMRIGFISTYFVHALFMRNIWVKLVIIFSRNWYWFRYWFNPNFLKLWYLV